MGFYRGRAGASEHHLPMAMGSPVTLALLLLLLSRSAFSFVDVDVGLVADGTAEVRNESATAISMGLQDLYRKHPDYATRVKLHTRDSGEDAFGAASAALDLTKNIGVQAILGPSKSEHAKFVIDLGDRIRIPIITFSDADPLSDTYSPYLARIAFNSSCQVYAIASIIKRFEWKQVIPVYEDGEFGSRFLPYLLDALQDVDAQVPYRSVISPFDTDSNITKELSKLKSMQTRVFIVHLVPPLSSHFFTRAKKMGMMSEGYVWIVTQGLTNVLHTIDPHVIASMQGVLGLKPYVPSSDGLENFTVRWKDRFMQPKLNVSVPKPSIFNLLAYDASWALGIAVEKAHGIQPAFKSAKVSNNTTDLDNLGFSLMGPRIMQSILNTNFTGISGNFHLVSRQLHHSAFQIINIHAGGLNEVGFWTQASGTIQNLPSTTNKNVIEGLKPIMWPGDVTDKPKGWELPMVLKVGVPVKGGFVEFVDTHKGKVSGYCIDFFEAAINLLPYHVRVKYEPYHFAQYPGSYDILTDQVFRKKFDVVVGDVTILANRSLFVDFTLPYTESGVSMVVPVKEDQERNIWVFLKPLSVDLWLAWLAFILVTGLDIWFIEHPINDEFRGPPLQQLGTIFHFAFSTMVYAHKEKLLRSSSKLVLTFWQVFMLILISSYVASLASMLTAQQVQPAVAGIDDLLRNGDRVGYQDGSFVKAFLEKRKFTSSRLRNYSKLDAYEDALSKGSKNGGVSAIIDEIPYLKIFLKNRCSKYVMIGPILKTAGFGFVFPKGSPLGADVSRAILKLNQRKSALEEKKWFGDRTDCPTEGDITKSDRLELEKFGGLFLVSGCIFIFIICFFVYRFLRKEWYDLKNKMASERTVVRKLSAVKEHYDSWDENSHAFKKRVSSTVTYGHSAPNSNGYLTSPASATFSPRDPRTPTIDPSASPSAFDPAEGRVHNPHLF